MTLGLAFAQSLPSLDGVAWEYSHEERAELLYDLCAALTREGLGTMDGWRESGRKCLVFAQQAIMKTVGEERWNLLKRNVEFRLEISDSVDPYGNSDTVMKGRLVATIECHGCGYLRIGPAIDALERETEGLGAAFYWELLHTIYRVMRIYDHQDALQYEEQMREWAADEESTEQQYEFPEVEKALPEYIRLKRPARVDNARQLLRRACQGAYKGWIARLRRMQRLARARDRAPQNGEITEYYDSQPLPSLLIAFRDHDAITACFDEESQHMLEGSSEPALQVFFDPTNAEDVRRARRSVSRFVLFSQELFEFTEELVQWEKDHGHTPLDRTEPSLRAA
jgi:hypothetical protein